MRIIIAEMFVEEVTQLMPWWGWVVTGIGLTIMIYAIIIVYSWFVGFCFLP